MELPQATLDALPRPDRSNANNGNAAEDKLNNFEKQQSDRAVKHIKGIIEKRSAGSKGKKDAIIDLKGMHCVPYPSFETISDPDPVDFALQGSCIYIVSPRDTHPSFNLKFPCPNGCGDNLAHSGWAQQVRCCHGLDRTHYIMSRQYKCSKCEGEFYFQACLHLQIFFDHPSPLPP